MRLQQLTWIDKVTGNKRRAYSPSKEAAVSDRMEIFESLRPTGLKKSDIDIEQIEVPTDKAGLVAWLNEHASS